MDALTEEKLTKEDTVVDLLENKVVLIKPKDGKTKVTGFENVTDAENMALAGEDVPVGQYSREIFTNLGIMDKVNEMEINECKNTFPAIRPVVKTPAVMAAKIFFFIFFFLSCFVSFGFILF